MTKRLSFLFVAVFLTLAPCFADTKIVFEDEQKGLFQVDIAGKDRCISYSRPSPFELNVIADSIGVGVTLGGYLAANLVRMYGTYPEYIPGSKYPIDAVSPFDRWAMNPYSKTMDNVGSAIGIATCVFPVVTYGMEWLLGNLPFADGGTLAVMFLESFFLSGTIKDFMKISLLRARPYMYFDGEKDPNDLKFHDFEYSFPSGHTTWAFMGATFLSYTFCNYYPDSVWRIPVIAASYAFAVGTGIMRVTSGNHFLTDVLAGAGIGAVCGFLVPFAHTFIAKANQKLADYSERTGNPRWELASTGLGLNVRVNF